MGDNRCLNRSGWQLEGPFNTKMTISERQSTTVFDRSNLTIIDIVNISDPTPTNYTVNDFFTFYDIIFLVNETDPSYNITPQYLLVRLLNEDLISNPLNWFNIGAASGVSKLQQLLTTIPLIFNNMFWQYPFSSDIEMGTSVVFAIPRYRVPIPLLTSFAYLQLVDHRTIYPLFLHSRGVVIPGMVPCNTVIYIVRTIPERIAVPRNRLRVKSSGGS
jgi:hypothetical protein